MLGAWMPAAVRAQDPVLIREVVSREYGIHVGGVETLPQKEIVSRELSFHVENGRADREVVSREYDLLVDHPGAPPAVSKVAVSLSPTGETLVLDWSASNPWAVRDIQRFEIYLSDSGPVTDITGLSPNAITGGDIPRITLEGLAPFMDHYFAIVAVDGLGNRLVSHPYHAAYVLSPEVISREVSLFTGQEPEPPYKQVVSREYDLAVDRPGPPPATTGVIVRLSPTGDAATLDWSSYNQWAVGDIQRFDIYLSDAGPFTDITGLTPFASTGGGSTGIQLGGLSPGMDHYFAVVPVDALGNRVAAIHYSAGYVLMPELVSREVSLFTGQEPEPPFKQVVSREMSVVISDGTTPAPVTGIGSGFSAETSISLFGAIDLDWTSYNELLQRDVSRYRIYLSDTYFEDVSGMEPHSYAQTGTQTATVDGFPSAAIRYVAVVAEDAAGNFNTIVRAHSVQASYLPYFRFFDQTVVVHEGAMANISVVLDGLARTGTYQLAADTARPFDGSTGDYVDAPLPLEFKFNPSLNTSEANLQIPIIRDSLAEPDEEFAVLIINPNAGSTTVVASVRVVVKDGPGMGTTSVWHPEVQALPAVEPGGGNQLAVEITPPVPGAMWRLVGEPFWRLPGAAHPARGLAKGMHRIEYKPVAGYGPPAFDPGSSWEADDDRQPTLWIFEGSGANGVLAAELPALAEPASGSLQVIVGPQALANAGAEAERGQWRLSGETVWRDSGTSLALPAGKHWVEFKDSAAGFHSPVPRSVRVSGGLQTLLTESYRGIPAAAATPVALAFAGEPGSGHVTEAPQCFTGQIESSAGYGSGVAVTMHTAATAGRVVFDQDRLAGALDVVWFNRRHADLGEDLQDERVAPVRYPRGYKLLSGYADMRTEEAGSQPLGSAPGQARSDQQDLAVLFFVPDKSGRYTAGGGFSGFLADFSPIPRPNPWLAAGQDKTLCGYPMSGIPGADRGLMHATAENSAACEPYGGQLYRTAHLAGRPGMEGAPLYVRHANGNAYPAAIYLGENQGAIFRAFDRFVASAIYRAEWESLGWVDFSTGGGSDYTPQFTDDEAYGGFLYVQFAPESGGWRLLDATTMQSLTGWQESGARLPVPPGAYLVEFRALEGFVTPSLQTVSAVSGLTAAAPAASYRQTYASWAEARFGPAALSNEEVYGPEARLNGLPNLVAFAFGLEPGAPLRHEAAPAEQVPGLPRVRIDTSTIPPTIRVEFLRRVSSLAPELQYFIEFADSPAGPWSESPTLPAISAAEGEWQQVKLSSAPLPDAGRKFVRVRIERLPP